MPINLESQTLSQIRNKVFCGLCDYGTLGISRNLAAKFHEDGSGWVDDLNGRPYQHKFDNTLSLIVSDNWIPGYE